MLASVLGWSLRHRALVIGAWAAIALAGLAQLATLPLDAFPDTSAVQVQVNVAAPALSAAQLEGEAAAPLERALGGLPALRELRSISRQGFCQLTLVFADGTQLAAARQQVQERLAATRLPAGIEPPTLGPPSTALGEIFHWLVRGEPGVGLAAVRTAQDRLVAPALRAVPGVAEVNGWGGEERQLHVRIDPARLHALGLSVAELSLAIEAGIGVAGGGRLEGAPTAPPVQARAVVTTPEALARLVVRSEGGVPLRLSDVATIVEGHEPRRGAVTADGRGEVVLGLAFALPGENGREVTRQLAARLTEVRRTLPAGIHVEPVYERSALVDRVLATVRRSLVEGALLVVLVLLLFLGNLRAGLLVALAIPLSMLFAGNLMAQLGVAGTVLSLGAIDFGLVVDSSVIQVENVLRRLAGPPSGRTRLQVVHEAVLEVRGPTMFGELILAIVYLPILTLEGVEGKLFRPMALTVLFALAGSLLLSLTLVPVLASFGLVLGGGHGEPRWLAGPRRLYRALVARALARPGVVLAVALLVMANGAFLATRLGAQFVPRLQEGTIVVNTVRLAGVPLEESVRYGERLERLLLQRFPDELDRVWTRTGAAEIATDPMGVELSDLFLTLTPQERWTKARTQDELVEALREALAPMPGFRAVFTQPIELRVNELVAGARADVAVKLFGDDLGQLREQGARLEAIVRSIPGAVDVSVEQLVQAEVLEVELDREALARAGLRPSDALEALALAAPRQVAELHEGDFRVPIALRLEPRLREGPDALARLQVQGPDGAIAPLGAVATLRAIDGPSTIEREAGRRRIVVQANVQGRDLGGFVAELERAIDARFVRPPGMSVKLGGQFEHLQRASRRLALVVPLALALVALLLFLTYRSVADAARVLTGVPFAMAGGIVALWARGLPFSVPAGVGFVVLCGVSVLADMVLASTIRQRLQGGAALHEAILDATEQRLRPVVMTALVASLGFLPMALHTGIGAEVQRPFATVVIGGVLSSTLLSLVVLPVLYALVPRRGAA